MTVIRLFCLLVILGPLMLFAQTKVPATQLDEAATVVNLADVRLVAIVGREIVKVKVGSGIKLSVGPDGAVSLSVTAKDVEVPCERFTPASAPVYYLPSSAEPVSVRAVYRNGVRQKLGFDYTVGADGKITPLFEWHAEDIVIADGIKLSG